MGDARQLIRPGELVWYGAPGPEPTPLLDSERLPFLDRATVIVPRGSSRGIEAEARLAFLAVRIGPDLGGSDRPPEGRLAGPWVIAARAKTGRPAGRPWFAASRLGPLP